MKNVKNDKILKMYESLVNMRPHVQAVSPKVCIGALLSNRRTIEHVL